MNTVFKILLITVIMTINADVCAKVDYERCIDTFTVSTCDAGVDTKIDNWLSKMNGKLIPNNCPNCDTLPSLYNSGIFRTALFIRKDTCVDNHSHLTLIHIWNSENRKKAQYRIPNVTSTIKQEFGVIDENALEFGRKSYLTFAGLTLINSGIGLAYGAHDSPFYYNHPLFITGYGIMDLAFTIGMFLPNEKISRLSMGFLPLTKAITLLQMILIKEHNKLGKTGYKFRIIK